MGLIDKLYLFYFRWKNERNLCRFGSNSRITSTDIFEGNNYIGGVVLDSYVGYGSYIMDGCWFKNCRIGRYCSIATDVRMVARKGHPTKQFVSTSPAFHLKNTMINSFVDEDKYIYDEKCKSDSRYEAIIGNDVWIGTRVLLMGSITIGDGAIIGAGTIVTEDVPPYAVVVGVPGRILRYRFPEEKIDMLKQIKWWDKDREWIEKNADLFSDIDSFLKKMNE